MSERGYFDTLIRFGPPARPGFRRQPLAARVAQADADWRLALARAAAHDAGEALPELPAPAAVEPLAAEISADVAELHQQQERDFSEFAAVWRGRGAL